MITMSKKPQDAPVKTGRKTPCSPDFFRAKASELGAIAAALRKVADGIGEANLSAIDVDAIAKLNNGKALIEHFLANAQRELKLAGGKG